MCVRLERSHSISDRIYQPQFETDKGKLSIYGLTSNSPVLFLIGQSSFSGHEGLGQVQRQCPKVPEKFYVLFLKPLNSGNDVWLPWERVGALVAVF